MKKSANAKQLPYCSQGGRHPGRHQKPVRTRGYFWTNPTENPLGLMQSLTRVSALWPIQSETISYGREYRTGLGRDLTPFVRLRIHILGVATTKHGLKQLFEENHTEQKMADVPALDARASSLNP